MTAKLDQASGAVEGGKLSDPDAQQPAFPDRRRRLAVLIDAENANYKTIPDLLTAIETHGAAVIRRAYGDWRNSSLDVWRPLLAAFAIRPIQRSPIRAGSGRGRNAADIALVVDAMDLLHTAPLDGFCIVSSDSDFADLALRIKEAGLMVIGVGRTTTPEAFKACCTRFIEIDRPNEARTPSPPSAVRTANDLERNAASTEADLAVCLDKALGDAPRTGKGWALIKEVKKNLPKQLRSGNLLERLKALGKAYEVQQISPAKGQPKAHYVRRTPRST